MTQVIACCTIKLQLLIQLFFLKCLAIATTYLTNLLPKCSKLVNSLIFIAHLKM